MGNDWQSIWFCRRFGGFESDTYGLAGPTNGEVYALHGALQKGSGSKNIYEIIVLYL